MRDIKYIILHCTAGPQTQKVSDIKAYWKKNLGWSRPGYHHLISPDGTINNLQPIELPTNGVAGYNQNSIHISYIGGIKDGKPFDNRTPEQIEAMKGLVLKYREMYAKAKVLGHRDFSPDKNRDGIIQPGEWMKSCPSFSVSDWIKTLGVEPTRILAKFVKSRGSNVNIRKEPNATSIIVGQAIPGTAVIVISEKNGWSEISINDKVQGWMKSEFLIQKQ